MSLRVTEDVMIWALRFCSRRSPWQQVTTSIRNTCSPGQRLVHIWGTSQNQTHLAGSLFTPVRFYSQEWQQKKALESLAAAEIQSTELVSEQIKKTIPFPEELLKCGSPSDVLDLTSRYPATSRRVSNCLTRMWTTMKKMSEEQRRYELQLMIEHHDYDKLLQKAMNSVGHMRSDDLAHSLLAMIKLGVPQRSRVVQTFLRACQENLNDFDEKSLSILCSCLEQLESSPNVDALKEGMRLVVEARLPSIENVMALQTMMRMLGKDAPLHLKRKLEQKALSMTEQFSLPNCQYMISTMAKMGFYSKPLLDICSSKITENVHGIPFNRMFAVLRACRELHHRDSRLLAGFSHYVASTMDIWSNKQIVLFLSVFENLTFCPSALMEAFAQKVISNPDALTLRELLCIIKVYSSLNYDLQRHRQQFLHSVSQALESYLPKMSSSELLKAVYCLCVLGHFSSALLEQLLLNTTLQQLSTTAPKFLRGQERKLQTVDLCLRLDRPPLPRPLAIPPSVLGGPAPTNPSVNPRLSQALWGVLEDRADGTLQEMVIVENFHLIDGVITTPLPVTEAGSQPRPTEGSQRIAVICTPPSSLCYGTSNPRGPLAVKIRHLKILGYTPVLVTEQELESVSEEQRVEFLRARIFPEHQSCDREEA